MPDDVPPWMRQIYDQLPSYPEEGAAIDHLLKMLATQGPFQTGVNMGANFRAPVRSAIDTIMAALSGRREALGREVPYDVTGTPVGPSTSTSHAGPFNPAPPPGLSGQGLQEWMQRYPPRPPIVHYGAPEYPPPGVDPTEWAMQHPGDLPPAELTPIPPGSDVTLEDINRWAKTLSEPAAAPKATTTVKKTGAPKPKPKPKPRRAEVTSPWDTIVTGLGEP